LLALILFLLQLRQVFACLLIGIFCLPALGTWGLFSLQQQRVRKEIKQKIKAGVPLSQQTLLGFSKIELESGTLSWINDHEFRYQGVAFDVLKKTSQQDSIYFSCIRDEDETRLFKTLDDQVNKILNQDKNTRNQKENTFRFYRNLFFADFNPNAQFLLGQSQDRGNHFVEDLNSGLISPENPPPEQIF
jgi:hypothetical protein